MTRVVLAFIMSVITMSYASAQEEEPQRNPAAFTVGPVTSYSYGRKIHEWTLPRDPSFPLPEPIIVNDLRRGPSENRLADLPDGILCGSITFDAPSGIPMYTIKVAVTGSSGTATSRLAIYAMIMGKGEDLGYSEKDWQDILRALGRDDDPWPSSRSERTGSTASQLPHHAVLLAAQYGRGENDSAIVLTLAAPREAEDIRWEIRLDVVDTVERLGYTDEKFEEVAAEYTRRLGATGD